MKLNSKVHKLIKGGGEGKVGGRKKRGGSILHGSKTRRNKKDNRYEQKCCNFVEWT